MAELIDSGARREFKSGAVRDISDDKGRCDLLPLDVVARIIMGADESVDPILMSIDGFIRKGDRSDLEIAIRVFCNDYLSGNIYTELLEVAKHYADGARKYDERNWEKGFDLHCFIDSGVRHYLKFRRGDEDEPHDRAFIWNMLGALWTYDHKPELNDLPFNCSSKETEKETDYTEDFEGVINKLSTCFVKEEKNNDN